MRLSESRPQNPHETAQQNEVVELAAWLYENRSTDVVGVVVKLREFAKRNYERGRLGHKLVLDDDELILD